MAKLSVKVGATSVSVGLFIQDSSSTTGAGLTGLAFNTSSLTCYAVVPGSSAAAITLATLAAANSAWSSGGFKEIDATNMPGWYRFDIPNTNISTGRSVGVHFKGATNMAPLPLEIELTGWDNQDAVRGGMTALPNSAAEAAGGLYTRGSGAGQINQPANGSIDTNTKTWNALTTVALPLVPTTAGRTLDVSAGGEAGLDWSNIGAPTTAQGLTGTTIATSQVVASVTGAVGSVTGAVGSVTGAVGSVTGNVGGNVVGSVASVTGNVGGNVTGSVGSVVGAVGSVTGAVGSVTGNVGGNVVGSVASVTGNVGGNVTGSVGSVVGAVGSVTGNVGGNVTGTVASVVDISTTTLAESAAVPAATATPLAKLNFMATVTRNKVTQTATTQLVRNDTDAGTIATSTISDDGTTFTRGKFA